MAARGLRLLLGLLGRDRLRLLGLLLRRRQLAPVLAGNRVLELAHPLTQRLPQIGKPLGPEDDQHDDQDDHDLEWAYTQWHGSHGSGALAGILEIQVEAAWGARPGPDTCCRSRTPHMGRSTGPSIRMKEIWS